MQSSTNSQSDIAESTFQNLLVQEFLLESNLRLEFGLPEKMAKLVQLFSEPTAKILNLLIISKVGLPIPPDVIKRLFEKPFRP